MRRNRHANRNVPPLQGSVESKQAGKAARGKVPRSAQAEWTLAKRRHDLLAILIRSDEGRIKSLLPIRYGRMAQSPFGFLRGSAAVMAFDLSRTPTTGIRVQACGDCHLMNFGAFATPERNVIFDINDFDETLPAPWEWDVKRLAASIMVAGRYRQFSDRRTSDAVLDATQTYREKMAEYAEWSPLQVWYAKIDASDVVELGIAAKQPNQDPDALARAAAHTSARLLPKITEVVAGRRQIRDDPPLVYHTHDAEEYGSHVKDALRAYRDSLPPWQQWLVDRYKPIDVAMKVVGVGSVGTRCAVTLLESGNDEPLFLQFKEARSSVLEPYAGKSAFRNEGQRVVVGQRRMQSASDLFLGWSRTGKPPFDFYVRQLHDIKVAVNLDSLSPTAFKDYVRHCGWAAARAHAKTGDAAMIAAYLGNGDNFDAAIERFAQSYADQTEKDHESLVKAIRAGQVRADTNAAR